MRIAFVTDGGLKMGMGHIYRSISIAEELKDTAEICFVTKSDRLVVNRIEKSRFRVYEIKSDRESVAAIESIRPDIIIVDRLEIERKLAAEMKAACNSKLVLFCNLSEANKIADVVVNAIIGRKFGSRLENERIYDKSTETIYFFGPRYMVLKNDFYEFRRQEKLPRSTIKKILLVFGGSDPSNLTSKALNGFQKSGSEFEISVILGTHFVYFDEFQEILHRFQHQNVSIEIFRDVSCVAELMFKADLVVTSPGISVFEALSVWTPVIVVHHNKWQKNGFKGFVRTLDKSKMGSLGEMIDNRVFIDPWEEDIRRLEIGKGKEEVLRAIVGG